MALTDEKLKGYMRRILLSRMRILGESGFYGLLLMHMRFAIDENCETAATDGEKIIFGPAFMDELSDRELDFIMMHEILHDALQHCLRNGDRDQELFNIACDIVVNSNIMQSSVDGKAAITLRKYGESMHIAPDGQEGYNYTAEQVYEMLAGQGSRGKNGCGGGSGVIDDHSRWGRGGKALSDKWSKLVADACKAADAQRKAGLCGRTPVCADRILKELKSAQTDWRTILQDFIDEEVVDYSFNPPDRRFDDSGFFLPDFNGTEKSVKDILFMIDTSGSMTDEMITQAYSEVKGAIDQFDGRLRGWLGFFDAEVVPPQEFASEEEFRVIRPKGGGGTRFDIIFSYVFEKMQDSLPASIIILTDGYADFPKQKEARGIPVLWIINNEEVNPPWGKVARIWSEEEEL